jgi:hypothetical protein
VDAVLRKYGSKELKGVHSYPPSLLFFYYT